MSGSDPKVSFAMPVFNGERYLARAIESLLGQTFTDFEFIISDNASSDGTEEICRQYAASDPRVRYIRRDKNIGGPRNFNFAFGFCRGQYVKWATADDVSHRQFIELAVAILDSNPDIVLCFPRTALIDAEGSLIEEYEENLDISDSSQVARFRALYAHIGLCNAQLGLMRRTAMARTGLMANHLASDVDFLGEMALLGKFHQLRQDVWFYRRMHPAASSWSRRDPKTQAAYYSPDAGRLQRFNLWRRHGYQIRMIWRSASGVGNRIALTCEVLRWAVRSRDDLWQDLWEGKAS